MTQDMAAGSSTGAFFDVSAIAFDLDGTLLDAVHELATAVNALLAELRYPPLDADGIVESVGDVADRVRFVAHPSQ